jgi:prepilin-type N-terminal cleavage/methylation domain-containing protein
MKHRIQAFTLLELLLVMGLIAILSAIAIPNLIESRRTARQADIISMMRELVTTQEVFRARELGGASRFGTLAELSNTPVGHVDLISWPDPDHFGQRNNYQFEDVVAPTDTTWCISASPITSGDGDTFFASTEDGFIRFGSAKPTSHAQAQAMSSL